MDINKEISRVFAATKADKSAPLPFVMVECQHCFGGSSKGCDSCEGFGEIDAQEIIEKMTAQQIIEGLIDSGDNDKKLIDAIKNKTPQEIGVLVLELAAEYGQKLEMKK